MLKACFWFNTLLFALIMAVLLCTSAFPYSKVYLGEDNGLMTYGVIAGLEYPNFPFKYEGEVETWLTSAGPTNGGWEIEKVAYKLEASYGNIMIGHACQHYLLEGINKWDAQNYVQMTLELPGEWTGGSGTRGNQNETY